MRASHSTALARAFTTQFAFSSLCPLPGDLAAAGMGHESSATRLQFPCPQKSPKRAWPELPVALGAAAAALLQQVPRAMQGLQVSASYRDAHNPWVRGKQPATSFPIPV